MLWCTAESAAAVGTLPLGNTNQLIYIKGAGQAYTGRGARSPTGNVPSHPGPGGRGNVPRGRAWLGL